MQKCVSFFTPKIRSWSSKLPSWQYSLQQVQIINTHTFLPLHWFVAILNILILCRTEISCGCTALFSPFLIFSRFNKNFVDQNLKPW